MTTLLQKICKSVHIHDTHSFSIFDQRFELANRKVYKSWSKGIEHFGENMPTEDEAGPGLVNLLTGQLYTLFYCQGKVHPSCHEIARRIHGMDKVADSSYLQSLSHSNQSKDHLDRMWRVINIDGSGKFVLTKNEEIRSELIANCVPAHPLNAPVKINDLVHIRCVREVFSSNSTFYFAYGEVLMRAKPQLIRFYFNTNNAPELVKLITLKFNHYQIPFSFKCPLQPRLFDRVDNAVLYIDQIHLMPVLQVLQLLLPDLSALLDEDIPLFTKSLAPGIAMAEDPGNGQSFGISRCELIARALFNACNQNIQAYEDRVESVKEFIAEAGYEFSRFYARPNSHYPHDFSPLNPQVSVE